LGLAAMVHPRTLKNINHLFISNMRFVEYNKKQQKTP